MATRRRRRYKKRRKERVSNLGNLGSNKKFFEVFFKVLTIIIILLVLVGIGYFIYKGYNNIKQKGLLLNSKRIVEEEYFSLYENNKWGIINGEGTVVISPENSEMLLVPNKSKKLFIKTVFADNVDENKIKKDSKYKTIAVNENDSELFKKYDEILPIEYNAKTNTFDQDLLIYKENNGKYGLIDYEGTEKLPSEYDKIETMDGVSEKLKIKKGNKFGVYSTKTKEFVVPVIYKSLSPLTKDLDTSYMVVYDKLKGAISSTGKKILDAEYNSIEKVNTTKYVIAEKGGSKNIYNLEGEKVGVAPSDIVRISPLEYIITGKENNLEIKGFKGNKILDKKYQDIKIISKNTFIVKEKGKYNVIDFKTKKLQKDYDSIDYIDKAGIYIATLKGKDDIYDVDFNKKLSDVIVSETDNEKYLLVVDSNNNSKFYNFKFEEIKESEAYSSNTLFRFKENSKYGYKDINDNVVVPPIYDDAKFQNKFGFAAVNRDGVWGAVNYKGDLVVDPNRKLDDYIKIDFIGIYNIDKNPDLEIYTK